MGDLGQYRILAADWRGDLVKNQRRTRNVIILFVLIYLTVGLAVDTYMVSEHYLPIKNPLAMNYYSQPVNPLPIKNAVMDLITFKVMPVITMIMLIVAFISIFITFYFHKGLMMLGTEYHEVQPGKFESREEQQLYNVIEELKIAAGLNFMPKVYIIEADYMNAFASGYSEKTAMVAITRGLMQKLNRNEIQAVMAHELSHVRHNDIKLALTVAILSNIILIFIDIIFRGVLYGPRSRNNNGLLLIIVLARFLLPILTLLLMLYLSRTREFMADAGSVELIRENKKLASELIKKD